MYTRRQFGSIGLAGLGLPLSAARIDSKIRGVQLGIHTYSYSTLPQENILDTIIGSMTDAGIGECILLARQIPASVDYAQGRDRFERAGIAIFGLSAATGENLRKPFEDARALGAGAIALGGTRPIARQLAPIADEQKMTVAFLGRPNMNATDSNLISKPDDYDEVLQLSKNFALCFDIGDATAGGYDALKFVERHHERIAVLCLKDRNRNGVSMPWGEGDTPVRQILQTIRDAKYPIRCYVDCDYKGSDRLADIRRCFEYARKVLE